MGVLRGLELFTGVELRVEEICKGFLNIVASMG